MDDGLLMVMLDREVVLYRVSDSIDRSRYLFI